ITDGGMLQAEAVGSGAVADSLTVEQLQPVVAQAIAAWRAAGVTPEQLSNLERVTVHVDNLPRGELGEALPGEIWIDRTAAGWGWSGTDAAGRMDLATVVTHELGHVLGFEHNDTGVMEPTLAPGVRLVPALPGSTVVASVSVAGGTSMATVATASAS